MYEEELQECIVCLSAKVSDTEDWISLNDLRSFLIIIVFRLIPNTNTNIRSDKHPNSAELQDFFLEDLEQGSIRMCHQFRM